MRPLTTINLACIAGVEYGKPNGTKFKKQNCLHIQQIFYHGQERFQSSSPKSIQVTFKGFSFKVTAYFNQAQKQKLTHSTNFNLTSREYCVKFKKWAFLSFNEKFFSVWQGHLSSF